MSEEKTLEILKNLLADATIDYEVGRSVLVTDFSVKPDASIEEHRAAAKKAWALAGILRAISTIGRRENGGEK